MAIVFNCYIFENEADKYLVHDTNGTYYYFVLSSGTAAFRLLYLLINMKMIEERDIIIEIIKVCFKGLHKCTQNT